MRKIVRTWLADKTSILLKKLRKHSAFRSGISKKQLRQRQDLDAKLKPDLKKLELHNREKKLEKDKAAPLEVNIDEIARSASARSRTSKPRESQIERLRREEFEQNSKYTPEFENSQQMDGPAYAPSPAP